MPPDHSTTTQSRIGVPPTPPPSAATDLPANPVPSANHSAPSSAGDPAAGRFRNAGGGGARQRLTNLFRARTRNTTAAAASPSAAETDGQNQHATTHANEEAAHAAAQRATTSPGAPPDGAEPPDAPAPTSADAQKAAEAQKLQEQIELARNNSGSSLDGLSESTRNDLMAQLGGNKNWKHEGIRQADELAKDMAKQSERWGKI